MIHIFTITCGRTELLELQAHAYQKYLQEPFRFTAFNNSMWDHPYNYDQINTTCRNLGIDVIDIQKDPDLIARCQEVEQMPIFNGRGNYSIVNLAAQYSDNWAWENVISKQDGPILLTHADVFMQKSANLTSYLENYQLAYVPQARDGAGEYMHDALVLANMPKLPEPGNVNWCGGKINGVAVDGGGQTYHYLQAHPEVKTLRLGCRYVQDDPGLDFHPSDYENFSFEGQNLFLHYRTGFNWNCRPVDYHTRKTEWLKKMLEL